MKKGLCLLLILVMLAAALPVSPAQAAEAGAEPVFGSTIGLGYGAAYVIKQDGSLWIWGEPAGGNEMRRKWPAKLAENVAALHSELYWECGIAMEKADGTLWKMDIPEVWPAKLSDVPIEPFVSETWVRDRDGYHLSSDGMGLVWKKDGSLWYVEFNDMYALIDVYNETNEVPLAKTTKKILLTDQTDSFKWVSGWVEYSGKVYILKADKTLWEWTFPREKGAEPPKEKATRVMTGVDRIFGDFNPCYALKEDNSIWMFDIYNDAGTPEKILEDVRTFRCSKVFEGMYAAIQSDGSLWMWGNWIGANGEYNYGSPSQKIPVRVMVNVADVDVTCDLIMALKTDGTLFAWGRSDTWNPKNMYPDDPENEKDHPVPTKIMDGVAVPGTPLSRPSPWAKDEVARAKDAGLVPDTLQPWYQGNITRAEFAALAVRLIEKVSGQTRDAFVEAHAAEEGVTFTDTADKDILALAALGIVNGVGNNRFNPDGAITREQAARMLCNTARALGLPDKAADTQFADGDTVSAWARESVRFVAAYEVMNGTGGGRFSPQARYTREMSIATVLRLYDKLT